MYVRVQTAQNVEIDYEVAGIGERVLAGLLDELIQWGYIFGVLIILSELDVEITTALSVILYLPFVLYHPVCEIFLDGQSFGKKARSIKVVKLDGSLPTIASYLLRWLLKPIDFFFALGLLVMAINGKGQRLGDLAAGTTIVKLKPRVTLEDTLLPEIEEDYQPRFPEVARLSDRDVALIKEIVDTGVRAEDPAMLRALDRRIKQVLGIESTMPPHEFLSVVLKDYTYYTQG